jgi:hypothetical protein
MNAVYGKDIMYTAKELENVFEWYDARQTYELTDTTDYKPSRSYHNGRIYGSGHYGNPEKEHRYQMWIKDDKLVESSVEEYYYYLHNYGSILTFDRNGNIVADFDSGLSEDPAPKIVLRIPVRPTEIEEGEIVDENDIYPNDLLDEEPFIRAPVISAQAAEIMRDEFDFSLCLDDYYEEYSLSDRNQYYEDYEQSDRGSNLWDIQQQQMDDYEEMINELAEKADIYEDEF